MRRFALGESWRLLTQPQSLGVMVLVGVAVAALLGLQYRGSVIAESETGWYGALTHGVSRSLAYLVALVPGVIGAGAIVVDRRLGLGLLIVSRGVRVRTYVIARAASMFLSAAAGTLVVGIASLLAGAALLPHRPARSSVPIGPFPELFQTAPLLNDVLYVVLLALGCGGLACLGVLIGQIVSSAHLAAAVPFVGVLASLFLLEGQWRLLSPFTYLELSAEYPQVFGSVGARALAAPLYWAAASVCVTLVAIAVLQRTERL